ncbi:putative membrane protein [Paraburkholderia xenovorans LB400]|nr:hypothetical protein [Paraburkholderia xenovorans]AIP36023.1 putative membrane protein [Paraburkholderia xenovorans LB400]
MKMSHKSGSTNTAGPVWGLVFGVLMTAVGTGLWFYATSSVPPGRQDESLAIAVVLVGLFLVIYAGRELCNKRR